MREVEKDAIDAEKILLHLLTQLCVVLKTDKMECNILSKMELNSCRGTLPPGDLPAPVHTKGKQCNVTTDIFSRPRLALRQTVRYPEHLTKAFLLGIEEASSKRDVFLQVCHEGACDVLTDTVCRFGEKSPEISLIVCRTLVSFFNGRTRLSTFVSAPAVFCARSSPSWDTITRTSQCSPPGASALQQLPAPRSQLAAQPSA